VNKLLTYGALALAAILGLASCGGGSNTITAPPDGGGGAAPVATVVVLAASPQLPSDQTGVSTLQITAQVKDAANAVLEDIPVSFGATSGSLAVTQSITDATGLAIAELSNGTNPANRSITVTATAGGVSGSVTIAVTGSTVTVSGPAALAAGLGRSAVAGLVRGPRVGAGVRQWAGRRPVAGRGGPIARRRRAAPGGDGRRQPADG